MTGKGWINITGEYGLVVRRAALVERAIALDNLLKTLEVDQPLDQSDDYCRSVRISGAKP
ncbi:MULTISPECIES: hypothetical protein [unclassified Bradyrhizobium]|uniref:hypothetical protein n=1 Tax=unclassified Bradyrhizobium TaxID=2631580 RepID=UPI001FFC0AD4|nr:MULTISPECIES: hypothetical protein [unclassified Bradyrhizobium]MCK1535222.1 hypothetical protein [Bradyrhizobium sp. 176]MCK1559182.1 hypothetical protein [Bradyrhizobium sp. 171]